jgi:protocatechuate 3,4-dioxygenase beta subunit
MKSINRRRVLSAGLLAVLAACTRGAQRVLQPSRTPSPSPSPSSPGSPSAGASLAPTPECVDDDDATLAQTEGPYYTPDTPERTMLRESGMRGTTLLLTGTVVDTDCRPVASALVDFWQADDAGEYDNDGYRLRGHQFTDAAGRWRLDTVRPGLYPGRTRHIHVKVQAPNRPVLTTQLYFPNEPGNRSDRIYHDALVLDMRSDSEGTFRFVLDLA